ncbi:MAG: hypothetical protein ACR2GS_08670 [Thermomicrobiales bacterium]
MVWRRIFNRDPEPEKPQDSTSRQDEEQGSHSAQPTANPPAWDEDQSTRSIPLHLRQALTQQRRSPETDDPQTRLATLRRRRAAALHDVEQGEQAQADDNPWRERAELLTESLETIESDRSEALNVADEPYHQVEPVPIRDLDVNVDNDIATVTFAIGNEPYRWEEPRDWAERGHHMIREDLVRTSGATDPLVPSDVPEDLRDPLRAHLDLSLFVLATDLRDRALNDEPFPTDFTLADLARPCPKCGGWTDALGHCQACARRNARIQQLDLERNRLLSERAEELEEKHRMAERLPIARRRLADIDTEIAGLEKSIHNTPKPSS